MTNEMWMFLVGQLLGAASIYTAIRVDLREHKVRIGILEEWIKEHSRK